MNKENILKKASEIFFKKIEENHSNPQNLSQVIMQEIILDDKTKEKITNVIEKKLEETDLISSYQTIETLINKKTKNKKITLVTKNGFTDINLGPYNIQNINNTRQNHTIDFFVSHDIYYLFEYLEHMNNKIIRNEIKILASDKTKFYEKLPEWYTTEFDRLHKDLVSIFEPQLRTPELNNIKDFGINLLTLIKSNQNVELKNAIIEFTSVNKEFDSFAHFTEELLNIHDIFSLTTDHSVNNKNLNEMVLIAKKIDNYNKKRNKNGVKDD